MALYLTNKPLVSLNNDTMIGAMANYITSASEDFQPMNANFGIMNLNTNVKKNERKAAYSKQSLPIIEQMAQKW